MNKISDIELVNILTKFVEKERHHIKNIKRNEKKEIIDIDWDAKWMNHNMKCPGKRQIKHHTCRYCYRRALHLLGEIGSPNRWCLECDKYVGVPSWYFK